ncbi:MAG: phosphoribosylformylglycinamidine synthase subunit PurS [Phycisphaerae bacterium]|nr:phosphoribosylformylglycinamidine synthase subunit PurS [Phycisphaerae bacterium]
MSASWRVEIIPRQPDVDSHGHDVRQTVRDLGFKGVQSVCSSRLFLLDGPLDRTAVERIAADILADPVTERFEIRGQGQTIDPPARGASVELHLKPGVMDPVAASTRLAIRDLGLRIDEVRTARRYVFDPALEAGELESVAARALANDCIERIVVGARPVKPAPHTQPYALQLRHVEIRSLDDEALAKLSREGHLFLSVEEMRAIRDYYRRLQREPTDLELETLAQTWSEHCVHKTLRSAIQYRGAPMPAGPRATGTAAGNGQTVEIRYDNLLRDTFAAVTHALAKPWCISVFEDNAGIIEFDEEMGVAFKVETHNHPSAIEPYGGAATGIGGVVRDIIGCGLGAKPVANTDVFCFAPPDYPAEKLPRGVLHPRRVMKGVVSGVRDYGNRMGIPTVNGAVYFDERYLGNPLVYCGTLGLIPKSLSFKDARPGDVILVAGGRTGRDGIHGATFSSAELTDTHADEFSHAVQIGNAITEKKTLDTILQARDHVDGCLYTAITDCGAGGLSSAVGEMGQKIGAEVDLEVVPLKYDGLRYDEIWISEAQERMVLAVPPENLDKTMAIFQAEDVEAVVIGKFNDSRRLTIRYEGTVVGEIDMEFLHEGLPMTARMAEWTPKDAKPAAASAAEINSEELKRRLGSLNVASKEWVIRQYDHEVQGGSVVKPLLGPGSGPGDAAVIRPRLDSDRAVAIGCGLCPHVSDTDPYWMAVHAVDEAFRNVLCVGGDPERTAILDNTCWGRTDNPRQLGALVRACQGSHDAAMAYGLPFISGKDSLNNEFAIDKADASRLTDTLRAHLTESGRIAIPQTLLISAISVVQDANRCVTSDLKTPGRSIVWVRCPVETEGLDTTAAVHNEVARNIAGGNVAAAHDVSDGGLLVALAEMCIAARLGATIVLDDVDPIETVWAEDTCSYVLELAESDVPMTWLSLDGSRYSTVIGRVQESPRLQVVRGGKTLIDLSVDELADAWRSPLAW